MNIKNIIIAANDIIVYFLVACVIGSSALAYLFVNVWVGIGIALVGGFVVCMSCGFWIVLSNINTIQQKQLEIMQQLHKENNFKNA